MKPDGWYREGTIGAWRYILHAVRDGYPFNVNGGLSMHGVSLCLTVVGVMVSVSVYDPER